MIKKSDDEYFCTTRIYNQKIAPYLEKNKTQKPTIEGINKVRHYIDGGFVLTENQGNQKKVKVIKIKNEKILSELEKLLGGN